MRAAGCDVGWAATFYFAPTSSWERLLFSEGRQEKDATKTALLDLRPREKLLVKPSAFDWPSLAAPCFMARATRADPVSVDVSLVEAEPTPYTTIHTSYIPLEFCAGGNVRRSLAVGWILAAVPLPFPWWAHTKTRHEIVVVGFYV